MKVMSWHQVAVHVVVQDKKAIALSKIQLNGFGLHNYSAIVNIQDNSGFLPLIIK